MQPTNGHPSNTTDQQDRPTASARDKTRLHIRGLARLNRYALQRDTRTSPSLAPLASLPFGRVRSATRNVPYVACSREIRAGQARPTLYPSLLVS
jgi:hypothetical protein